jgi:NADH-quinone oxidoreductase subunit H
MAEYGSMFLVSGLAAILFFGGWNGPIPLFQMLPSGLGLEGSPAGAWAYAQGETEWRALGYIAQVAGVMNFMLKATLGVIVMMWVRWTLPRLRIDQVMTTCLKYCVPLAAIFFVLAMGWKLVRLPSPHDFAPYTFGHRFAEVRENWVLAQKPATEPAKPVTSQAAPAVAATEIAP